jgi:UDP-3-O-[3-hydroxymyristoyl] N-acetylglucosamine deacetylase
MHTGTRHRANPKRDDLMEKTDAASSPGVSQRTLKNAIHCSGVGRHSGARVAMTLRPAPPDLGIVFSRIDLAHRPWISATWENAAADDAATKLVSESGVEVAGIEPLMSALSGCAIDNAMIELDGLEVPAMDGSAAPFVFLLECAGSAVQDAPRRALEIHSPIRLSEKQGSVTLSPGPGLTLDVACEGRAAAVGRQSWAVTLDKQTYKREVSRARYFDFLELTEDTESQDGRPDNAVTVLGDRIADDRPLRFANEFARQEVQCMIGNLYLAGAPIIGLATARRATRGMTIRLLEKLFSKTDAWSWSNVTRPGAAEIQEPAEAVEKTAAVGA